MSERIVCDEWADEFRAKLKEKERVKDDRIAALERELEEARAQHTKDSDDLRRYERNYNEVVRQLAEAMAKLNTPELIDFREAVVIEAAHQRERWGSNHDADKTAADWFWLIGYLAGKALHADKAGETDKLRHHIITTAAACANWHAATERIRT